MFSHSLKGLKNLTDIGTYREVLGYPTGVVKPNTFVILDSYEVPADGTSVEVQTNADTRIFESKLADLNSEHLQNESRKVGWYHSHPGLTVYLSSQDVTTTRNLQTMGKIVYKIPAIVIDPVATLVQGKLEIGAFCAFNEGEKIPN